MSDFDPSKHLPGCTPTWCECNDWTFLLGRRQKYPLPESASVIAAARRRRQVVLDTLHPWTQSQITEQERAVRQEQTDEDEGEIHLAN